MTSLLWLFIFGLALAGLLHSSTLLVRELKKLGKAYGLSSFVLGSTVLALSASLPELLTSLWASGTGFGSMVSATVVGSNVANLLLILGAAAAWKSLRFDLSNTPFGLWISSTLLLSMFLVDGNFTWLEGLLMLGVCLAFLSAHHEQDRGSLFSLPFSKEGHVEPRAVLVLAAAALAASGSSYLAILALENVSELLNLAPSLLGASLLAIGTSLPEWTLSREALKQGESSMVLGTLLGSNILNASFVMAVPSFFGALTVNAEILVIGLPLLLVSTLLAAFSLLTGKLSRQEGIVYLVLFGAFQLQMFSHF